MSESEVLAKCAEALHVSPSDFGRAANLIVVAVSEAMSPGQVVMIAKRRLAVVLPVDPAEYELIRSFNRRVRKGHGYLTGTGLYVGDRADSLHTKVPGDNPPPECQYLYLVQEV